MGISIRKVVGYCFSFDPVAKTYVFNLLRVSATVVILCTGGFLVFLGPDRQKAATIPFEEIMNSADETR